MTPVQEAALLSLAGVIISALVSAAVVIYTARKGKQSNDQVSEVTLRGQDLERLQSVEQRLAKVETDYRDLWYYTRRLLDLYYRHRKPGSPDPDPLPDEPNTA